MIVQGCKIVRRIINPSGMKWSNDSLGIVLIRQSDGMDYHPTVDDYSSKKFASVVRAGMAMNFSKRRESKRAEAAQKKEAAIFDKESKTVRVILEDSRRAGNCMEGSLKFAEKRFRMDRESILAAPWLMGVCGSRVIATCDARAMAAVRAAFTRETMVQI